MLKKIKQNKYQLLELFIIFVITLSYNLLCANLSFDEIWNYGFTYNIATGLIPYKDFNMVMTPLFPMLGAIFLNIFGKNYLVYHIFGALICTTLFNYMKKNITNNYYILYCIFLLNAYPSYNLFCILLLYIIMFMEDKKTNDYLIGIVLGLSFLTKQNIGIYLCIPTIFIKDIKRIFKRGIGFILPSLILLIYFLITNSLYEFIDYTFLGMGLFVKDNIIINSKSIIIFIISSIYLIYQYIKTKDIKTIYLFCFQLLLFPLTDSYHLMIAIIPVIGYFLKNIKLNQKLVLISCLTFLVTSYSIHISTIYQNTHNYPNKTQTYTYRKLSKDIHDEVLYLSNYVNNIDAELYIISRYSYMIKLEADITINKYDLLNDGNLGSGGEIKVINEIDDNCSNKKCVFLLELESLSDTYDPNKTYAKEIKEHIKSKYQAEKIVYNLETYINY